MALGPPKVFISYSHDSPEHARRVLSLAERLRKDGVDAQLDQYVSGTPPEGWPRWTLDKLDWAEFVLVVCTETYYKRFRGHEEPGKGKGADWEGQLISLVIYAENRITKFVPVLFEPRDEPFIPRPLSSHTHYVLDSEENYDNLYAFLTGQVGVVPSILGPLKPRTREAVRPLRFDVSDLSARQSALCNIPDRNRFFTGRQDVLAEIHNALTQQGQAALSGLGGVGKTQTALEYAHRHSAEYDHAFWVKAGSRESLVSGYVTIAGLLKLPEFAAKDQTVAVDAVNRWLTSHRDWLLILDNADDIVTAREFIPPGNNGHVLVTSRVRAVDAVARFIEVQMMESNEGALFLLRRAKYVGEDAALDAAVEANQAWAKEISRQLGGLPLALDQAGAYIEETGCGLSDYLNLYRKHAEELLGRRGVLTSDHPSVATTLAPSLENIERANPGAAELLRCCAFLHPDVIPEELFRKGAPELGAEFERAESDAFVLDGAIEELQKYSLIHRDSNTNTLQIHRLVQAFLKQGMDQVTQRLSAERAVRAVNLAFPDVEFSTWSVCERLLPQAQACGELINEFCFEFPEGARLLNQAGFYLWERGRYTETELLYYRALAILEKALGPEHPDVATSLNNLAELYRSQGKYAKAEALCQRSLAIRARALGPEHPDVATSLDNLAELYRSQGQYAKAEPLYQHSLAILEKALGSEHPNVALSLNNLAKLYLAQGRYVKAEPLYERALTILENTLGPEHPVVAKGLNNLALLYDNQGQYAKAEPLYERALAILEKALSPVHPDVATSLNNLAELYRAEGQYKKAEPLYQRALAIWETLFGPEHLTVAMCLNNLGVLYDAQGQYVKAEALYQHALATREKVLGLEHPYVAATLNNLAELYRAQGQYEKAEPLYDRALAILEKSLGPEHPAVATSLNNLALLDRAQGEYAAAERLYDRAVAISEKALGPEHPAVATSLNNLAELYCAQGQYAKAEPLFKRALTILLTRCASSNQNDANIRQFTRDYKTLLKRLGRSPKEIREQLNDIARESGREFRPET